MSYELVSALTAVTALVFTIVFQYFLPLIRGDKAMSVKLMNIYGPLVQYKDLPTSDWLDLFDAIAEEWFVYVPDEIFFLRQDLKKERPQSKNFFRLETKLRNLVCEQYEICQYNLKYDKKYFGFWLKFQRSIYYAVSTSFCALLLCLIVFNLQHVPSHEASIKTIYVSLIAGAITFLFFWGNEFFKQQ